MPATAAASVNDKVAPFVAESSGFVAPLGQQRQAASPIPFDQRAIAAEREVGGRVVRARL